MPTWVPELVLALITLGVIYALLSEGLWGAALMFFNVLFSSLIAFNFYEPLAALLAQNVDALSGFADTLCLLLLFGVTLLVMRLTTDSLAPGMVRFPTPLYYLGGLFFAVGGGAITAGVLILAFHMAPIHKKMFGSITYNTRPPFGMGLDHKFLDFFQSTSGQVFARYGDDFPADPFKSYGRGTGVNVFDPRSEWLIQHQEARPYGQGSILGDDAPDGDAGLPQGDAPGGGMAGGGGGGGGQGPGIPGGTAGAAIGLAPTGP